MSLLLQALQKASKNREGGDIEPGPDPLDSDELSLEPMGGAADVQREPAAPAASSPSPAQAAAVMQASRGPAFDPVDYAREHYMIVFVALAVLAAIGYGTYVYIQVANPSWLRSKPSVAPSSPLGAAAAPKTPVAAAADESASAKISGMPAGTQAAAVAAAPVAAATQPATAASIPNPAAPPLIDDRTAEAQPRAAAIAEPKPVRPAVSRPRRAAQMPARQLDDDGVETVVLRSAGPAAGAQDSTGMPPTVASITPDLTRAYEALQAGDSAQAKALYAQVLDADPRNIDALLGLGAIASKEGRVEEAVTYYQRVMELEPRNAYAQAGLIAIMGGADPAASETRLRQLIAREPSAFLYFTLGNLYADQGQWPGAQQAYFQAYQSQPDNPDYAFNLAVGLEHLGQIRQALDYYRKALDLSFRKGRANFDQNLVIQRVGQLSTRVEQ
jgi:tetratricopeptide (TPR) repeat protein